MRKNYLFLIIILFPFILAAQFNFADAETELAFHADVMVNASKSNHRVKSGQKFHELFVDVLSQQNSYSYPFDSVIWIQSLSPKDNSFRLFSWRVEVNQDTSLYFGIIQRPDGELKQLVDASDIEKEDFVFSSWSCNNWYGQLYYEVEQFKHKGVNQYLLFGVKTLDKLTRQKIVEPLIINEDQIIFGEELFYNEGRHGQYRLQMEFSSLTRASLHYDDELELIIFDYLTPVVNPYESNKTMMVPDGTFGAYLYKEGKWKLEERILDDKYKNAPVPEPVLRDKSKNILGK